MNPLLELPKAFRSGKKAGIASVCSAHPIVIEAALRLAKDQGTMALIEATCNQVNQDGGYTGMTPNDFRLFVEQIAGKVGLAPSRIILGGDHLGPNPWKDLPADQAMAKAKAMIAAFASAGFTKLHLDTSMGCAGESVALADELTAERAAQLAVVAEQNFSGAVPPVYVVGTEVPIPGGALEELDHLQITRPEAALGTYEVHKRAFAKVGQTEAFARVIALVVQPGVEFGHSDVVHFEPNRSAALSDSLAQIPGVVFEAHSTDYQTKDGLASLVNQGFSILKVGPWLTFALREALYGLDAIADILEGHAPRCQLMLALENVMAAKPENWNRYYSGNPVETWIQRHFSYSDRIRYYWPDPIASGAVQTLKARLAGKVIPRPLASQYLPFDPASETGSTFDEILINSVQQVLKLYGQAVQ